MGVSRGKDVVTFDLGVDDLADNVRGCETHHHAVFGRVVFVLVLRHQSLTGIVVGLALYSHHSE